MTAFLLLCKNTAFSDWTPRALQLAIQFSLLWFLGADGYASLALAVASVSIAWSIVDVGLGTYALREAASDSSTVNSVYGFYLLLSLIVGLVYLAIVLVSVDDPFFRLIYLACGLYLPCYAALPDWALRGAGEFRLLAIANWIITFITAIPLAISFFAIPTTSRVLLVAISFGVAPGCAVIYIALAGRLPRPNFNFSGFVPHLRASVPLGLTGLLMSSVAPTCLHVMQRTATASDLGLFAFGLRISTAVAAALWALGQNSLRQLMKHQQSGSNLGPWTRTFVPVALVLWVLVMAVAIWILVQREWYLGLGALAAGAYFPKYLLELALISRRADIGRLCASAIGYISCLVILVLTEGLAIGGAAAVPMVETVVVVALFLALSSRTFGGVRGPVRDRSW